MTTSTSPTSARSILDRFFAAERLYMSSSPENADFSGLAALLSPEMKLNQSPDLPFGGLYEGLEGFLRWSKEMALRFDVVDVQPSHILEEDVHVVVLSTVKWRVRKTQEELIKPFCQVFQVDREKEFITEIRPFYWDVGGFNDALRRAYGDKMAS